jgi:hypothetical protein
MKNEELIAKMLADYDIRVAEPSRADMICCARAEGFDFEQDTNWANPDFASLPRDLKCNYCNEQLVVSRDLYRRYEAGEVLAGQFYCIECVVARSMH